MAYAFIFLSLIFRTPWVTVFVLPIAVLLFTSGAPPRRNLSRILVERKIVPTRSIAGEDVNVTLTVRSSSPNMILSLLIEDQLSDELRLGSGTNRLMLSLRSGETTRFEYQISTPKRGSYQIGPTLIRTSDNAGFRIIEHQLSNQDELIVIPAVEKLGIIDLKGKRFGPWPGLVLSRRIGIGTEFFEISPYVPGEDLRRVNWKASARAGMLVTNEFEREQVIDVLLVLDCSEGVKSKLFAFDALEFQVSFAASLCSQLILQGNRVGLFIYGAARTWVKPGFGKRHLLRLLDGLAFVRAGPATLPIKYVTESVLSAILPSRSLVLLISPMLSDEVVGLIESIAENRYSIICVTPSTGHLAVGEASESARMARRIYAAERKLRIVRAGKIASVIELSPHLLTKPLLTVRRRWNRA